MDTPDPLDLAKTIVLMPNERTARQLKQLLIRKAQKQPLLLPRIVSILGCEALIGPGIEDLPPISPTYRTGILITLVEQFEHHLTQRAFSFSQKYELAQSLGTLMDSVTWENISVETISAVLDNELSHDQEQKLIFLKLILASWPKILSENHCLDPAIAAQKTFERLRNFLQSHPECRVILAGIKWVTYSLAQLAQTVHDHPRGSLVLNGLNSEQCTQILPPHHPQYAFRNLLNRLNVDPKNVSHWLPHDNRQKAKADYIHHLLHMQETDPSFAGLELVGCKNLYEEAYVISLMIREGLETPNKTIAFVTANRQLASLVRTHLETWKVKVDDSVGNQFSATPFGQFLLLSVNAALDLSSPVPVLAFLKHIYFSSLYGLDDFAQKVMDLEDVLIRPRILDYRFVHIQDFIKKNPDFSCLSKPLSFLETLHQTLKTPQKFPDFFAQHWQQAEELLNLFPLSQPCRDEETESCFQNWQDRVLQETKSFQTLQAQDYASLLKKFFDEENVRYAHGYHPRVFIWGPLEAQLLMTDRVILGDFTEGTWPPHIDPDPWLSLNLYEKIGLSPPEKRQGFSAHDFQQLFCARETFITYAQTAQNQLTETSRWLNIMLAEGAFTRSREKWHHWAQRLRTAPRQKIRPPRPNPPAYARPQTLPVTQLDMLNYDPFAVYSRYVLGLKQTPSLSQKLCPMDRGILLHDILHQCLKDSSFPYRPMETLMDIARKAFGPQIHQPLVKTFWWPRFLRSAEWFIERHTARAPQIDRSHLEISGSIDIKVQDVLLTVTGIADRFDILKDETGLIIDYKTGRIPSFETPEDGGSLQLPLLALIAEKGKFQGLPGGTHISALEFWQLSGGTPPGKVIAFQGCLEQYLKHAQDYLEGLIRKYYLDQDPFVALPDPQKAPAYQPYAHLGRYEEWQAYDEPLNIFPDSQPSDET